MLELEAYRYHDTIPPKKEEVCIKIDEKVFLTYGNFACIQGAPKSRKSQFALSMLLAFLSNKEIFNVQVKNEGNVLLLDTEQSHYDFYCSMQRIKKITGVEKLDDKRYTCYLMRMLTGSDIITHLELILLDKSKNIKLIILDSITDLVDDINSIVEAKELIQKFKTISTQYNIAILGLLHMSKTSNYAHSLGMLGSFIDRGAQSVIKIEKCKDDPYSSMITSRYLRSDMDFDSYPISFRDNGNVIEWKKIKEPDLIPYTIHEKNLYDIKVHIGMEVQYLDLCNCLKSRYERGDNWIKQKLLPYLIEIKLVTKENKYYNLNI